jgi:hypothetical protein
MIRVGSVEQHGEDLARRDAVHCGVMQSHDDCRTPWRTMEHPQLPQRLGSIEWRRQDVGDLGSECRFVGRRSESRLADMIRKGGHWSMRSASRCRIAAAVMGCSLPV